MSATVTPPLLLTAEEYSRLPDDGRCTELVRGRVVEVSRPSTRHGILMARIGRMVGNFADERGLGVVTTGDSGIVTEREPDTVRGADVAFYSVARLRPEDIPEEGYVVAAPELVFEVLSPSDRLARVSRKIAEYLDAGVTVVCVVNPRTRTVTLYRADTDEAVSLPADATLTFPDILPGFAVPVARLFE